MTIHANNIWIIILLVLFSFYCSWRLISKTGYPGFLALLLFIPIVNVIFILYMVFTEWPIESLVKRYEKNGNIPDNVPEEDLSESSTCMSCGGVIPAGELSCPKCGWSYKDAINENSGDQKAEPLNPTPGADIFKNQRGF